jgi:hypothetical protein
MMVKFNHGAVLEDMLEGFLRLLRCLLHGYRYYFTRVEYGFGVLIKSSDT